MKIRHGLLLLLSAMLMIGCNTNAQNKEKSMKAQGKKILIAYYSYSGNTRVVANQIKELTGGDICEIKVVKPYPTDYNGVINQAKDEIDKDYEPEITTTKVNINDYDIIFVGSPCWWYTIASPVRTFLKQNNLKGKTIIPFMTHGGSGIKDQDIKKLCPNATFLEGVEVSGSSVNTSKPKVDKWLKRINVID